MTKRRPIAAPRPVHTDEAHRAITTMLTLCVLGRATAPELEVRK